MSSKVLSGAASGDSEPFEWRRVARGQGRAQPGGESRQAADEAAAHRAEVERLVKEAYEKGSRDGESAIREKAAAEVAAARDTWLRGVEELARYRPGLRREAERDLVKLSLAIARRVLHRELTIDPGALLGIVKAALEGLEGREVQRIRVHPDGVAQLRGHLGDQTNVIADPSLRPGGLILETSQGDLDAGCETQLQEIDRGLADLTWRKP